MKNLCTFCHGETIDDQNGNCANCGAPRQSPKRPRSDGWDWNKLLPIDEFHKIAYAHYPAWEKNDDLPYCVDFSITKGKDRSSREIATEFDNIAVGHFYYRDWTESGLPFVDDGEVYRTAFIFQRVEDYIEFKRRYNK